MSKPFLSQLNYNRSIVDAQGRPTPEFQQKWRTLFQLAGTIPDVSNAAAMSLLLDMLSDDEGAILRRGTDAWAGLPSPGGTDKFLRADGTYAAPTLPAIDESDINLSDLLTNNVSSSRHGFAPKLPNDATRYLDGTGAYSVPAGGGGEAGTFVFGGGTAFTTTSHYWKGCGVQPSPFGFTFQHLYITIASPASVGYNVEVWEVVSGKLTTRVGSAGPVLPVGTGTQSFHFDLGSDVTADPNTLLAVLVGQADAVSAVTQLISPATWAGLPMGNAAISAWVDTAELSSGTSITFGSTPYGVGMLAKFIT